MARTTGPLMSFAASGSVGGAIVFSTWKGRPYVRQLVKPANPSSPGQVANRSMMAFLTGSWRTGLAVTPSNWKDLADSSKISTFNAFTGFNLTRWSHYSGPNVQPTEATSGTEPVLTTPVMTGGVRQASGSFTITTINDGWGVLVYRSKTNGFTPGKTDCVQILDIETNGDLDSVTIQDSPLDPGTYYYRLQPFTTGGLLGTVGTQASATVT